VILDTLANTSLYTALHPEFAAAFRFMGSAGIDELPLGRHDVTPTGTHALISGYATKEESATFIESHVRYIDIQVITRGCERIGICHRSTCTLQPYDEAKDCRKLTGELDFITLRPGSFAVFFPDDGHMPGLRIGGSAQQVRKVVVKVPVGA
jgi:YhcH/YjgK/YiaL family protein